jgi:protein gp37
MNKTKIEYADYTWNPVSGCTKHCSYCYANRLAQGRLRNIYLANHNVAPGCDPDDPFSPRFWLNRLEEPADHLAPAKIFACNMGDLWDPHVLPDWIHAILATATLTDWHTFLFLTKRPHLAHQYTFPPNSWVGITVESDNGECWSRQAAMDSLEATVRYISYEPLLAPIGYIPPWVNWIIIGAMTLSAKRHYNVHYSFPHHTSLLVKGKWTLQPPQEWVQTLIDIADNMRIPIFLKDNLNWAERRTEWPAGVSP